MASISFISSGAEIRSMVIPIYIFVLIYLLKCRSELTAWTEKRVRIIESIEQKPHGAHQLLTLLNLYDFGLDVNSVLSSRPSAPGYFIEGVTAAGFSKNAVTLSRDSAVEHLKLQLEDLLCLWVRLDSNGFINCRLIPFN